MNESAPQQTGKNPDRNEKFLDKPITRRNFLGMGAAAAGAYALKDWQDYKNEKLSQYEGLKRIKYTLDLMEALDLPLPKDTLYGFTFPTTKEMALKFNDAFEKRVGADEPIPSLTIIQEKNPESMVGKFVHHNRGITAPYIERAPDADSPSVLYLPEYTKEDTPKETIPYLYHEGIHLFYQEGHADEPERVFENENYANIANVLLDKFFRRSGNATRAYDEAVAQKKPEIWETYIKKLYGLPPNCCEQKPAKQ